MIAEYIGKEIIKLAHSAVLKQFKKINLKLPTTEKDLEDSINHHIKSIKNWSSEVTFKDLKGAKDTQSIYIQLNLYLYPRRIRISESENIPSISLYDLLLQEKKHIAILGQPGAGKTTSMKFICQKIFYDEGFNLDFKIPILIKLRDFNKVSSKEDNAGIIFEYLFNTFGLKVDSEKNNGGIIKALKERTVIEILEKTNSLLIIEGFDELSYKSHRNIVLEEITILANHLEESKMLITSRSADFTYSFENIKDYEFCALNDEQIKEFALKWLESESEAENFFLAIRSSPFSDTTIRPLTVAHLCAIYERIGRIPEKPKTVYKKIINLLLEEWDEQRNIKRVSKYGSFETDRKFEFLSALAFNLTVSSRRTTFSTQRLLSTYENIYDDFDLESNEAIDVVHEVESHSGLFIQSGFEMFEFAHKSLQEYLTAEYLVKLPDIFMLQNVFEQLPNELAIAISISSSPSMYFIELIGNRMFNRMLNFRFLHTFISRLILEKPDFNKNNNVVFSALLLYTTYLKLYLKEESHGQLNLFIVDDIVEEFEKLLQGIFKRNYSFDINQYYNAVRDFDSTNGSKIILFKIKNGIGVRLPEELYCRKKFLEYTVS